MPGRLVTEEAVEEPAGWRLFERDPAGYEAWYATPRGRRAERAERALLERLLACFPAAHRALEIGCGTGHFTAWLGGRIPVVVGLDRAPAMLAEARRRHADLAFVQGDAHDLPFRSEAVDVSVFITTLEFLARPAAAVAEAARVSRRGLVVLALNRCSAGAVSRRWGAAARGRRLAQARDFTPAALRRVMLAGVGRRCRAIRSATALFPAPLSVLPMRLPFGDVIGVAAELGS
jgi:SAM-dependent methyltransferase